ncbi:rubredoxin [Candidatus Geothermarchaeota archaeon]|nr:MAG: rubredoxin [Candidatus Geothermarchaeota archaeon]
MAVWKCKNCGYEKTARCKPRVCPQCKAKGTFEKVG